MLSQAAQRRRPPTRGRRAGRRAPVPPARARRAAAIAGALAILLLLSLPPARAGTFPVLQEQVRIGTTSGIAGAQAVDGLRETLTSADLGSNLTTAPAAQDVTLGSAVAGVFPADVTSADGIYAQYRETLPGPVTVVSNPATTQAGCTWTACDSGRLSDNVSATSSSGGDVAAYASFAFSVPASSVITDVYLGYEAFDPTGNDRLSLAVSWDGGNTWCPSLTTAGLPTADPNAYTFVNVTACTGHAWSPADFGANLTVRFTHVVVGGADTIDLDANAVRVTYALSAYRLDLRYDWNGIPSGAAYALVLAGRISNESVSMEVLTPPSAWTPRLTINGTTDQSLSYALASSELVSGNASIRFVDALGSSPGPSDLWIDLAEIVSVEHAYRLDVVQNVTGITGADPTLTVQGNISAGGGNVDVLVWDVASSAWTVALSAPFTATNAAYSAPLAGDRISNGTVRIDFREHGSTSAVPATLTLDFVGVEATDAAAAFPWTLVLGGAGAAAVAFAALLFLFVLPRRRRSEPEDAERSSVDAAEPPSTPVAEEPPAVPGVGVESLEPGHAYLVAEDETEAALRALGALTRLGRSGFVVTGRPAADVEALALPRHTTIVVLGDAPEAAAGLVTGANEVQVLSAIEAFLRTNPVGVVLLDRLESLAGPDGLPALLDLVQRTAAKVSLRQQILIASASPGSLDAPEDTLLREPFEPVRVSVPPAEGARTHEG